MVVSLINGVRVSGESDDPNIGSGTAGAIGAAGVGVAEARIT